MLENDYTVLENIIGFITMIVIFSGWAYTIYKIEKIQATDKGIELVKARNDYKLEKRRIKNEYKTKA